MRPEYFVIHDTAGMMTNYWFVKHDVRTPEQAVKAIQEGKANFPGRSKGRSSILAHAFIRREDGAIYRLVSWLQRQSATKVEKDYTPRTNIAVHVECEQAYTNNVIEEDMNKVVWTDKQLNSLADLYIEASKAILAHYGGEPQWLNIIPHIEMDRGIKNGHRDPRIFPYNKFYDILKNKGVPIDTVKKFQHERFWGDAPNGKPKYWLPNRDDNRTYWPPVLVGVPPK
ncbi:peptidoglycan recognition family protein [Bartonella sp. HY038]|uniref:peptidoglycan recognition protein family protein n=1 Tax=Bartonella sp. HY038 TaxID=2759660 RepID=UPI0015FA3017|nr:peptidoglycan recognition family protein [Bartonella sp. HY038]